MKNITVFAIFFGLLLPSMTTAAELEQQLRVQIGPFDAANVEMRYGLTPQTYAFNSVVETAGMFGRLYHFRADYKTVGVIEDNRLKVQDYKYDADSGAHRRTKKLIFDEKGVLQYRFSSKDESSKKVKVNLPKTAVDAYDLQTVFARLVRQFQQNKFCALEETVFDGKKKYKIVLEDLGQTTMDDPAVVFKGPAWKCSLKINRIDGGDGDMLWDTTSERPVVLCIMEHRPDGWPFVAKIEISSTPLGELRAYATKVNVKE